MRNNNEVAATTYTRNDRWGVMNWKDDITKFSTTVNITSQPMTFKDIAILLCFRRLPQHWYIHSESHMFIFYLVLMIAGHLNSFIPLDGFFDLHSHCTQLV
jgi:hypothetical protein